METKNQNEEQVEMHDMAYVTLKANPAKPEEPENIQELGAHIAQGYRPFAVTSFTMLMPQSGLMANKPPVPIFCERVWLTRIRMVPKSSIKEPEAPEALPDSPKA